MTAQSVYQPLCLSGKCSPRNSRSANINSTQVQLPSHVSGFLHSLECCAFPGRALLPRLWVVLLKNLGSSRPIGTIGATRINAGSWIFCSYNLQQVIPHLTLPTANVPNNINNSFFTTLRPLASLQPSSQHILGTTDISRPSKLSTHSLGSSWASCFRWLEVSNLLSCLVSQIVPIRSQIASARTEQQQQQQQQQQHHSYWCVYTRTFASGVCFTFYQKIMF